jgi:hypothetical protein
LTFCEDLRPYFLFDDGLEDINRVPLVLVNLSFSNIRYLDISRPLLRNERRIQCSSKGSAAVPPTASFSASIIIRLASMPKNTEIQLSRIA